MSVEVLTKKAKSTFWLDGSYDRAAVEACPYHPRHHWWVFKVGDVVTAREGSEELMVICRGCYVPRCGYAEDPDPCMLPRHHPEPHLTERRRSWPVGANP